MRKARKNRIGGERELNHDMVRYEGDGNTKSQCHEPAAALSSAERAGSSLESDIPGGYGARKTYSNENMLVAVIEVTSSTTWQ